MLRHIITGIDVGTYATRVVVAERVKGEKFPKILGTGMSNSLGMRKGYITNINETSKSIKRAIDEAEQSSGQKIKRAFFSIGGISLGSEIMTGTAVISKADGEVTSLDITKAINEAEESLVLSNKKIIEVIPVVYRLDGKEIMGRPEGMRGIKLEVRILFITCLTQHLEDLVTAAAEAGVEVVDVVPSTLAASLVALTEKQKTAGCILVNIGAETVSIAVFENNSAVSTHVFSIGSTDITHDIALGLRIPLEEAEGVKIGSIMHNHPKKKLDEIIEARLSDIFELIENHLRKIKRNGLLPAGVILVGGGAQLSVIEELSKSLLKLPSRLGGQEIVGGRSKIRDSSWFVSLGLVFSARSNIIYRPEGSLDSLMKKTKEFFASIGRQLLP